MNRETEAHFAQVPGIEISRSKFTRPFTHLDTGNASELLPVYVDPDILPGDTITMKQAEIVRMMTPIAPVMDNLVLDFYWFFVPNRLIWEDFKKFMGENETAPWTQTGNFEVPQIQINDIRASYTESGQTKYYCKSINQKGSVLDHMGIPTQSWSPQANKSKEISISALPTRAYCLIYNEFFRDQNLQNPVNITKSSGNHVLYNEDYLRRVPGSTRVAHTQFGGLNPLKVCKTHDYFTSALPQAQKAPGPITIPLSDEKVYLRYEGHDFDTTYPHDGGADGKIVSMAPMGIPDSQGLPGEVQFGTGVGSEMNELADNGMYQFYSDLSNVTGATVTALRQAFAIQKFYERDARSGTRYIEFVLSHFGTQNPDYRLQRPEYLGGFRQNINMNMVVQNSPTLEDSTPLGTNGAYSVTAHTDGDVFSWSSTEHGILMGLCCIRVANHTYQQGINRAWLKKKKFDFYYPEFANISEQYIKNMEIYAQGTSADEEAFGYQEAWAEMRYMPNIVSGEMRSDYSQSLDIWHYADYYTEKPTLGDKWIEEDPSNVARTLAVENHDQFMFDFYFEPTYTRPMPLYSVPGLIDHH